MQAPPIPDDLPAEIRADHDRRLFRLACHKRRTQRVVRWLTEHGLLTPRLERLRRCHAWMVFRYDPTSRRFGLAQARSCNLALLCPLCAIRRAARACHAYQHRAQTLVTADARLALSYAVLTILNQADLAERFQHLQYHPRLLLARRQAARSAGRGHRQFAYARRSCLAGVCGGAYSFEIKRGANSGLWHPHVNLLLLSPEPMDERQVQAEWQALTHDSWNVYCRPRPAELGTFVEIFKYALKFSDLSPADTYAAYQLLSGRRLMGSFGVFRGIAVPTRDAAAAAPYRLLLYRYVQGEYRLLSDQVVSDRG